MTFSRTQFDAAMAEVYRITAAHPQCRFLLRLCPEWHREVCAQNLALVNYDLDRIKEGPIVLGVGNVQISRAVMPKTHQLMTIEESTNEPVLGQ